MKFYRGSGRGARAYVEADHHRADDYYLAEGAGIAEMIPVDGRTGRRHRPGAARRRRLRVVGRGVDVRTGLDKGALRHDEHALRFAEVIVNGPKSWSLAAGLHPDISAALDAAQDRAVDGDRPVPRHDACAPGSAAAASNGRCTWRGSSWPRSGTTPPGVGTRTGTCICR